MEKVVKIHCTVDAKILINGEEISSNPFSIVSNEDCYITFLPTDREKYLPLSVALNKAENSEHLLVVPFDTHTEITFDPPTVPTKTSETCVLSKKFCGLYFTVHNSHKSFLNIDGLNFSHKSVVPTLSYLDFTTHDSVVVLTGKTETETYILIFNAKTKKVVLETLVSRVEHNKTGVSAVKFPPTLTGYGMVYQFEYSSKKLSSYGVYKNDTPLVSTTPKLIPLAFIEAIKYGDYSLAKHYLDNSIVSNEHLKSYFGDIKKVCLNGLSKDINYTVLSDMFKNYTFSVENGKITEIEENPLNTN